MRATNPEILIPKALQQRADKLACRQADTVVCATHDCLCDVPFENYRADVVMVFCIPMTDRIFDTCRSLYASVEIQIAASERWLQ